MEGWLLLKTTKGFLKSWKKRFFFAVLEESKVYYFEEDKVKIVGEIDLSKFQNVQPADNVFEFTIACSGMDTLYLRAVTEEERDNWVEFLRECTGTHQSASRHRFVSKSNHVRNTDQLAADTTIRVTFTYRDHLLEWEYRLADSPAQMKAATLTSLKRYYPQVVGDFQPDHFILRVKGLHYYIVDEEKPLANLPWMWFFLSRSADKVPLLVKLEFLPKQLLIKQGLQIGQLGAANPEIRLTEEEELDSDLRTLIGDIALDGSAENESTSFRQHMALLRLKARCTGSSTRSDEHYQSLLMPAAIGNESLPVFDSQKQLQLSVKLPGPGQSTTILCPYETTAVVAKQAIMERARKFNPGGSLSEATVELKVPGRRSYLRGNSRLLDFDYVRTCLREQKPITLVLAPAPTMEVNSWLLDKLLMIQSKDAETVAMAGQNKSRLIWEIENEFRVKIVGIVNLKMSHLTDFENRVDTSISVCTEIVHGGQLLAERMWTKEVNCQSYVEKISFNQSLLFNLKVCDIPKAARICFTLYATPNNRSNSLESEPKPLGWVNYQLIDHKDGLRLGDHELKLWPGRANPIGTCVENITAVSPLTLTISFDKYKTDLVLCRHTPTMLERTDAFVQNQKSIPRNISPRVVQILSALASRDALSAFTESGAAAEKQILWENRYHLLHNPSALAKFLQSVDWGNRKAVLEAERLLRLWAPLTTIQALELLDAKFASAAVRQHAVACLHQLSDSDLADVLLQLTQVLKYEPYHESALASFLMLRAYRNPDLIGHSFFWYLKSELHVPQIAERYSLFLEAYLRGIGAPFRRVLREEDLALHAFEDVANKVKQTPKEQKLEVCQAELRKVTLPPRLRLPLWTEFETSGLKPEKCKYMKSKKQPLWLVFEDADDQEGETVKPHYLIFKSGDDLRQDVLTLQMIRLMDKLWKKEGLDLRLSPYNVIATGDEVGMLEVVLNSETTAAINKEAGGARQVLKADRLTEWLKQFNTDATSWARAVDNFALSTAGYCVATYVLGIGDRHNDNIMLTRDGRLFHIDFGHFLGHFKKKFGFEREKAPFVFTPQFAHVLGGKGSGPYQRFEDVATKAYNIVRKNASLFINLFSMMLSIGLKELQSTENILYLREQLLLDSSEEEAALKFRKLVDVSLATKTQQFMDVVHILAN